MQYVARINGTHIHGWRSEKRFLAKRTKEEPAIIGL